MTGDSSYAITTVVYCLIFVAGVAGNLLVIMAVVRFKKLRTMSMILVTNLSLCDMTLLVASIPLSLVHDKLGYFTLGKVGCRVVWPLSTLAMTSAVFTLVAIAAERFSAIVFPFRHKRLPRFDIYAAALVHLLSLASVVPYSLNLELITGADGLAQCVEVWSIAGRRAYTVFLFLVQYLMPLLIMAVLYGIIWITIRNSSKQKLSEVSVTNGNSGKKKAKNLPLLRTALHRSSTGHLLRARQSRQRRRSLKMFGCIVSVFAVCVCPTQVTWLWNDFYPNRQLDSVLSTVFYFFVYTNSVLNAWIYSGFNKDFKKAYRSMLKCKFSPRAAGFKRDQSSLPLNSFFSRSSEKQNDNSKQNIN